VTSGAKAPLICGNLCRAEALLHPQPFYAIVSGRKVSQRKLSLEEIGFWKERLFSKEISLKEMKEIVTGRKFTLEKISCGKEIMRTLSRKEIGSGGNWVCKTIVSAGIVSEENRL
jgi:hypothetical protein